MRTLIVSNIMSVDGFYEGPGRDMMVLNMDGGVRRLQPRTHPQR